MLRLCCHAHAAEVAGRRKGCLFLRYSVQFGGSRLEILGKFRKIQIAIPGYRRQFSGTISIKLCESLYGRASSDCDGVEH
jgi:hypothetical protein